MFKIELIRSDINSGDIHIITIRSACQDDGLFASNPIYFVGTGGVSMTGNKMVKASAACCTGYKVLMGGSGSPDSRGWYRLENSAGLYRGAIDPFSETPHDPQGELRLEYGDPYHKKTVTYVGPILYGLMQGEGRIIWPDGTLYKGGFKNGCRHGSGVLVPPHGPKIRKFYYYGSEVCTVE